MAITFFNDARSPATDGAGVQAATATITPPASMVADDYVVVFVASKQVANANTVSVTGGQTWTSETALVANTLTHRVFHCRYNGTWAASPAWDWVSAVPYEVWMLVFRGVHLTTAIDAGPSTLAFAAPSAPLDVTIAASRITTVTNDAMLVACWSSADDNSWTLQTGGWANPNAQPQWRNLGGSDSSMSVAYLVQATAGATAAVTNRQTALGGDAGITEILALRPAPAGVTVDHRRSLLGVGR